MGARTKGREVGKLQIRKHDSYRPEMLEEQGIRFKFRIFTVAESISCHCCFKDDPSGSTSYIKAEKLIITSGRERESNRSLERDGELAKCSSSGAE